MKKKNKTVVYCGVTTMDGKPYEMSKEEQNTFTRMCGNAFDCEAVFCNNPPLFNLITIK